MLRTAEASVASAEARAIAAVAELESAQAQRKDVHDLLRAAVSRAEEAEEARVRIVSEAAVRTSDTETEAAQRVEALEGRMRQHELAASEANALVASTRAEFDAFKSKARAMMEEKDKELEEFASRRRGAEPVLGHAAVARPVEPSPRLSVGYSMVIPNVSPNGSFSKDRVSVAETKTETVDEESGEARTESQAQPSQTTTPPTTDQIPYDGARMNYIRNVVRSYLTTDDWQTHDSLVPVIGKVLGFSEQDFETVKTKRDALMPLDITVARYIG